MKKNVIIAGSVIVLLAALFFGAIAYYTPPQETFAEWHKSYASTQQDAAKRNVPMMVKVGAEM